MVLDQTILTVLKVGCFVFFFRILNRRKIIVKVNLERKEEITTLTKNDSFNKILTISEYGVGLIRGLAIIKIVEEFRLKYVCGRGQ